MPQLLRPSNFVNWFRRVFIGGANSDVRPEMLKDGLYTDALNMRPVGVDGNTGALEAIAGEQLLYGTNDPNAASYICIGQGYTSGHEWEFWASTDFDPDTLIGPPPLLKIDGDVVAQSPNIPYVYDKPLQVAPVERCREGLLFPADHYSDPLIWDIGAVLQAFADGSDLYFGGYTTDVNSVALNAPPSWPLLDKAQPLVDLGSGIGLPVGQYAYSLRYVDPNGNRTNWSPETPLIPVPAKYTPDDQLPPSNYPGGRTFGGVAGTLTPTPYGISLRFRVDNQNGYASVEIKRRRYNDGGGLLGPGIQEIVYRVSITAGIVDTMTFVDPEDSNLEPPEVVAEDASVEQYVTVRKPKSVDYSDGRVKYFNFMLDKKKLEMGFVTLSNGLLGTSITKKLTRMAGLEEIPDGYSNPYNATYYKSAQRGEPYGYGAECWNGAFGKYPVQPIPGLESYLHPNQRDIKGENGAWAGASNPAGWGAESDIYSDDPCYAATVDLSTPSQTLEGPVGRTFAAMTQGSQKKTDTVSLVNVSQPNGIQVGRDETQFDLYASGLTPQVELSGSTVIPVVDQGYAPWDPRDNQAGRSGYNIPPNTSHLAQDAASGNSNPYNNGGFIDNGYVNQCFGFNPNDNKGQVFAPTYHALGLLLGGITSIPDGVSAITIARTAPAGRVVAQGFGTYHLRENNDGPFPPLAIEVYPAKKDTNALIVHFPDVQAGIIDQATLDDIQQNPGNYQVQVQCGLGFHTETYGYTPWKYQNNLLPRPWVGDCIASYLSDQISYGRIMEDHGQVNPGEIGIGGMGYQPNPGMAPDGNYVGHDKWRSGATMQGDPSLPNYSFWQQGQDDFGNLPTGNALFDIAGFTLVGTGAGRQELYYLQTDQPFYTGEGFDVQDDTGTYQTSFYNDVVRTFHQPWFVVNIVKTNTQVPDANIQPYVNTGATFAVKQCIGIYQEDGTQQDFRLEDDYEFYNSVGYLGTDYRYTYAQQTDGVVKTFLCATNNTLINIPQILADIALNGSTVVAGVTIYGLYEAITDSVGVRYLRFGGTYPTYPEAGSRISIRYPEGTPIRVFGHDVTIAPVTHAIMDEQGTRNEIDSNDLRGFPLGGLPLPYAGFGLNPRYFMPDSDDRTEDEIFVNYNASIRQWCVMWDAESRVQPAMYVNLNSTSTELNGNVQMFPFIHYVIRPYLFDGTPYVIPQGFYQQYQDDYPLEWNWFNIGGLRFQPGVNLDYARQQAVDFFGYPQAGYNDEFDYCTGYIASLEYDPVQQDMANLRTFLFQNMGVLSDETGEIKVGATYLGPGGQNTVVWTQKGVARILTNKNVLTGASGEQVSTQSISNYWGEVMFLSRNIGLPDQFWRLWSKGYATAGDSYMDTFFWPDRKGWYRMRGDQIEDIARGKQLKKLLPILEALPPGYTPQVSGFYNTKFQEMWGSISAYTSGGVSRGPHLLIYSPQTNEWLGEYAYRFDGYINTPDGTLGCRDLTTWNLDVGYDISGQTREAWVYLPIIGDLGMFKEMTRWRVVGTKPDGMQLFDKDGVMMSDQSEAIQEAFEAGTGALWTRLYASYEGWWWRVMASYDTQRRRAQDVRFFVKVIYNTDGEKSIVALENLLKNIR